MATCCVVMTVILAGVAVGLAYHFTDGFQKPTDEALADAGAAATDVAGQIKDAVNWDNLWPSLDHYLNEDPHRNVTGPADADKWAMSRNQPGLKLHVLNALTDDWHQFYDISIVDWDDGNPDVLTLSTETITPEYDCAAENQIDDVMKVCNGNYGDNGWRGLNTCIIVGGGTIVSSVAQMNEFYLQDASDEWKQYTMCHEIGHGFGLPHTDEEFWNRDLGNCLDYTNNPSSSMHPDVTNFEFLASMYGSIDGSIEAGSDISNSSDVSNMSAAIGGVNRQLQQQPQQDVELSNDDVLLLHKKKTKTPDWVLKSVQSIHEQLDLRRRQQRSLLRGGHYEPPLRSSSSSSSNGLLSAGGESHQIDLGQGYSVVIHMLHA